MHRHLALLGALTLGSASIACGGNGDARRADASEDAPRARDAGEDLGVDVAGEVSIVDGGDGPAPISEAGGGNSDAADGLNCGLPVTQDGTCNSIALPTATIRSTCSAATTPQASGGAIEEGTYVLESMTFYGVCPSGVAEQRASWVLCAGAWQAAEEVQRSSGNPDAGTLIERFGLSVTLQPASIVADVTCWSAGGNAPAHVTWAYDATPGRLSIYVPFNPGVRVDSFVRR